MFVLIEIEPPLRGLFSLQYTLSTVFKETIIMSCNVTAGRLEACKDQIGGLKAMYIIIYDEDLFWWRGQADYPLTARGIAGTPSAFKFDLHGNNTFNSEIISSRENGTTYQKKTLEINLKGLEYELFDTIMTLAKGRFYVAIETRAGVQFSDSYHSSSATTPDDVLILMGCGNRASQEDAKLSARGAELISANVVTGSAMGDFTGATIVIESNDDCGDAGRTGEFTTKSEIGF